MTLANGSRLGPYEILGALGAGGMGEVYKARDTRLDRTVAIKILPEALAANSQFRERFDREARTISQLDHAHICALYDVGEQDGTSFLVMQYLEGETLEARLKKGALPLDQALNDAIQIADALATAHKAGIVHRDLKPGNVMLTKSGAKLLDFGLAKTGAPVIGGGGLSMLPTTPPNLTAHGAILGTFQYMAPEQLEGQEADVRTDIFAFGAVVYEMVTGKKAFEGKSQASLIAAILEREPPPISSLQPLTPPTLDRLVKKCLAKDPDDRWQSASDLRAELVWTADARATASGVSVRVAGAVARPPRERLPWLVAAGALVVAILAVPTTTLYFRRVAPELPVTRLDLVTPPTADPFSFALSPDGRQIVFAAVAEGGAKLWLRSLDQTDARPLAGTEGASAPFWRPDGRAVGFFADARLKRIDLTGGATQVLAEAPATRGGTWNRDGVIVFAPTVGGSTTSGLMRVAATGGTATVLTRPARGQLSGYWPQFLPDGRRFLFVVGGGPDTRGVYVGSLDGSEPTRVLATDSAVSYAPPGYLLLVSQGVLVARRFDATRGVVSSDPQPVAQAVGVNTANARTALSVSATGVLAHRSGAASPRQLLWVDRAGKTLEVLGPPQDDYQVNVELAPDARQVAVSRNLGGNADVWRVEVASGLPSRFTFNPANEHSALWSPDGSELIFPSNRNGHVDLFEKPANGATDEHPFFVNQQDKEPLSWSRQFLLYAVQDPKTQSDLFALPLVGERKPVPVATTIYDEVQGQFSPDGRWVAYASNLSGRYEIYIRAFPSGGQWQVSTGGGITPRWRHDGHELFYVAPDNRMMAAPITVASDARTLSPGAPVPLFPSRLTTGISVGGFSSRAQYAVAADGRFLLNVSADNAAAAPITIVLNWTAALK
jgi:Tol biopolymer transport system component